MSRSTTHKGFATRIFVTREDDGDNGMFLAAHGSSTENIESGQKVAVYAIVEVATMRVAREIVRADGSVVSILD